LKMSAKIFIVAFTFIKLLEWNVVYIFNAVMMLDGEPSIDLICIE
jgi:hypothetical protein